MNSKKSNQENSITLETIDSISRIKAEDWNRIIPADYPFLSHEFLHALEDSGCVSADTGWAPQHIVIRNPKSKQQELLGAAPFYVKSHSWGEFIFDWDWAHGYQQSGVNYYPKLVSQTPFTPLTSPKLLVLPGQDKKETRSLLAMAAQQVARQTGVSSIHWHFVTKKDAEALNQCEFMSRASTFEYIWKNQGYRSMDDFLGSLSSRKRKKIRSERRSIGDQGISVTALQGDQLEEVHWKMIDRFHQYTVDKYLSHKYLTIGFFKKIGETMPEKLVFFLAKHGNKPVAGSFCLQGGKKLYGRYWGTLGEFRNLHFEVCYYAAIEYCIERGLKEYNAGVQGEHKLSRGFLPRVARSSHSFFHYGLSSAIDRYIERESYHVQDYCELLDRRSAYRNRGR